MQTERWPDIENARLEVVIPGKPGQMSGTLTLRESGGTTTETVELEVRVGIPLVGGKIESLIADLMRKALKVENAVGRQYLDELTWRSRSLEVDSTCSRPSRSSCTPRS